MSDREDDTPNPCTGDWWEIRHTREEQVNCHGCGGAIHGPGFIAALGYYLPRATSFLDGVPGFFEALLWPAFLVCSVLKFIGAGGTLLETRGTSPGVPGIRVAREGQVAIPGSPVGLSLRRRR